MLFRLYTIFPYVKIVTTSCEKLPAFLTDRNDAFAIPNAKANEVRPTTTYEPACRQAGVSELVSWAESFRQQTSCWAEVLHVSRTNPCILLDLSPLQTIYACENRDVMDDVSLKEFYKKIHEQKTSDEWMREAQAIAIELSQLDAHTILSHERCMQISATLEALDTIPVKESEELRVAVEELRRVLSDGLNRYMHRIG